MYGIGREYAYLEVPQFDFPDKMLTSDRHNFLDEREFMEFLIRNDWIQRRIGIKMFPSNGIFPDIHGIVYDGEQTKIKVEIEYAADNYKQHGHPFGKADLVLSFTRKKHQKVIRGCPIWAFYIVKQNGELEYCLDKDINFDFKKYDSESNDNEDATETYFSRFKLTDIQTALDVLDPEKYHLLRKELKKQQKRKILKLKKA